MFKTIAGSVCFASLTTAVVAQSFPAIDTVFVYDVTSQEGDTPSREYVAELTIVEVDRDIVTFALCELDTQACSLGQTDGIFAGYFEFYDLGDPVPTRLIEDMKYGYLEDVLYPPGQYTPYVDGREVIWERGGSAKGRFTQTCCVAGEDGQQLWKMTFQEVFNGGGPTTITQHVDPELGWFVYERAEVEFATLPTQIVELRLSEVRASK